MADPIAQFVRRISRITIFTLLLCSLISLGACTEPDADSGKTSTGGTTVGDTGKGNGGEAVVDTSSYSGIPSTIPFHGNRDEIKELMGKQSGAVPDMTQEDQLSSQLRWNGGTFEGIPVDQWWFGIYLDRMTFAQLHYTTGTTRMNAEQLYDKLTENLTARYGAPLIDSKRQATALIRFSEPEQQFISKIASSVAPAGDFRLWTETDSTAQFVITLQKYVQNEAADSIHFYEAWYDRKQTELYFNEVEKYQQFNSN